MSVFTTLSRATAAALIFASTLTTAVQADQIQVSTKSTPKSFAGANGIFFDWLALQGEGFDVANVAFAAPLGNGSWICSPSGFGKKSQCYAR